jgi:hypothetical protein
MDQLDEFYDSLRRGMTVADFTKRFDEIFHFIESENLVSDYRLGKGRTKRLRDEVGPAANFLKSEAASEDQVQFPLDNSSDDCIWQQDSGRRVTIQITLVQGRERFYLASELNDSGIGRGYLGLADDKSTADFEQKMAQPHRMYSTPEAQKTIIDAVTLCAEKKSQSSADLLLIVYPNSPFSQRHWSQMKTSISNLVEDMPNSKIVLVVEDHERDFVLRLKDAPFRESTEGR